MKAYQEHWTYFKFKVKVKKARVHSGLPSHVDSRTCCSFQAKAMGWYGMDWYGMGWTGMGWVGMDWYESEAKSTLCSMVVYSSARGASEGESERNEQQ